MPPITYCQGWFRAKKYAPVLLDPAEARRRHDAGELYTALVGEATSPQCFLEIRRGFVGVDFLDALLRCRTSYSFQAPAAGRLFLSMATHRDFVAATDQVAEGTTYMFQPSGEVQLRRERLHPTHELATSSTRADVSGHWEDFPAFGDYAALMRLERGAAA
jgi:hypothetical protein